MDINDKDAGAYLKMVSGGGARGVAAGAGDNTEAVGDIVDSLAEPGIKSGAIIVCGSATLADAEGISINSVKIEHGDAANLSDKADAFTAVSFTDVKVSSGGTTELFAIKLKFEGFPLKRYWRVACTPDLSASGTDTFELGFCAAVICEASPQ
jgi:hypothetical protein